jgi:hypothetical protein
MGLNLRGCPCASPLPSIVENRNRRSPRPRPFFGSRHAQHAGIRLVRPSSEVAGVAFRPRDGVGGDAASLQACVPAVAHARWERAAGTRARGRACGACVCGAIQREVSSRLEADATFDEVRYPGNGEGKEAAVGCICMRAGDQNLYALPRGRRCGFSEPGDEVLNG